MSTLEPTSRCAVCAADDVLEQHHLALRSGCETAIVPFCPRCHDGQTDRQRRAGLIKRSPRGHETEGLDLLCGLVDGLAGILTAHARQIGDDGLVQKDERQRRATLRLLSVLSGERPGALGPRPISNDRLGDVTHRREVPAGEAGCTSAQSLEALAAGVLPALAAAIGELTGDSEVTRAASAIAAGSAQFAEALHALEHHPRAGDLIAAGQHANTIWIEVVEQIAAFCAPARPGETRADLEQVDELIRDFHNRAIAQLKLVSELAAGGDPELALARYLSSGDGRPAR